MEMKLQMGIKNNTSYNVDFLLHRQNCHYKVYTTGDYFLINKVIYIAPVIVNVVKYFVHSGCQVPVPYISYMNPVPSILLAVQDLPLK